MVNAMSKGREGRRNPADDTSTTSPMALGKGGANVAESAKELSAASAPSVKDAELDKNNAEAEARLYELKRKIDALRHKLDEMRKTNNKDMIHQRTLMWEMNAYMQEAKNIEADPNNTVNLAQIMGGPMTLAQDAFKIVNEYTRQRILENPELLYPYGNVDELDDAMIAEIMDKILKEECEEKRAVIDHMDNVIEDLNDRLQQRNQMNEEDLRNEARENSEAFVGELEQDIADIRIKKSALATKAEAISALKESLVERGSKKGMTADNIDDLIEEIDALPDEARDESIESIRDECHGCKESEAKLEEEERQLVNDIASFEKRDQIRAEEGLRQCQEVGVQACVQRRHEENPELYTEQLMDQAKQDRALAEYCEVAEQREVEVTTAELNTKAAELKESEREDLDMCAEIANDCGIEMTQTPQEFLAQLHEKVQAQPKLLEDEIVAIYYEQLMENYPEVAEEKSDQTKERPVDKMDQQDKGEVKKASDKLKSSDLQPTNRHIDHAARSTDPSKDNGMSR
jgi:hypothetical protein